MKKTCFLLIALMGCFLCRAQEEYKPQLWVYHHYREYTTTPPYGIQKIQALIRKIETVEDDNGVTGTEALTNKSYSSLSLREKFTYNMIHGEAYAQTCDVMPLIPNEGKKIFGQLLNLFGENGWADRQRNFFKENKDSVMALMTESIGRTHRVGLNYKYVIVDINATAMIPLLISTYNEKKKDHDILTVLMLLMLNNKYAPFMSSVSYKKLYAGGESSYRVWLEYNTANEELILQRATDFYNGLPK